MNRAVSSVSIVSIALACSALGLGGCTKKQDEVPKTFHFVALSKIKTLDPVRSDDVYASVEVGHAYEGLLQYHYLKRPLELIPNLAESMPEVSADGRTITFKIKKGVLFQDDPCFKETGGKGRELVAEDFIYSWKRLADPKNLSPSWWILDGKVVGATEWHDEAVKAGVSDYSKPIEGLKALDPYTLQIRLKQRTVQFLYNLAMDQMFVTPHEAVEMYGNDFGTHAVGTGPFRLESYSQEKVIWRKNPTFRKELYPSEGEPGDKEAGLLAEAGQPLPRADRVITHVVEESQPRWLGFLAGEFDFSDIPKDNYSTAIAPNKELVPELKAKGIVLSKNYRLDVTHTTFNLYDPLFAKNKLLRQALSLAFDSNRYIDLFYNGRAIPAQGPIPPGIAGYDPSLVNPYRQFNLAKAKELLAKAGYPEGKGLPTLELLVPSTTTDRQDAEFAEQMFAPLGVKTKIEMSSWPEFDKKMKDRKGHLWNFGWQADYPDAENFLQLFYSKNVSPGPNDSSYSNPEYDALFEKALSLPDGPERKAVHKKMVAMLMEDAPWIFNAHRIIYIVAQPWITGLKSSLLDHGRVKYIGVDLAKKGARKK